MAGRVAGKVALVTGAASGLGAESARRLAREGASLVLTDLAADSGEALAREIGEAAFFLAQDFTDEGRWAQLTKAAALEWAPAGIRVNSVHPGYIVTPMVAGAIQRSENGNEMRDQIISRHALGRLGVAREIADGIVFLASDESSFMTGAELVIDGGYTAA